MKLRLNPSTKKTFTSIISTLGLAKVLAVLQQFLDNGQPLTIAQFAQIMDLTVPQALELAQNKGELDKKGQLVGFLGFSVVPTNHQLIINGKIFYTWCAADTLIFPAILGVDVIIISSDPLSNENIRIQVNHDLLIEVLPVTTFISWVDEVDQNDIRCSMCNRVHFFASEETSARWLANNQDARVFPVAKFFSSDIIATECL
jgi:alkylmercury lyase